MDKLVALYGTVPVIVRVLIGLDLFFAGLYILNLLWGSPYQASNMLLDLNSETSFSTWYSSIKLFCIAVLFGIFCWHLKKENGAVPIILLLLPALFCLMSMDEIVMLHETLGDQGDARLTDGGTRKDTAFKKTGAWFLLIGIPFLIGFFIYLKLVKKLFNPYPNSFAKLGLGMAIFLSGAVGFEFVSNLVPDGRPMYLVRLLEETLEMLGATVMLWAAFSVSLGRNDN